MNESIETETAPHHHGYISDKGDYLKRLRRIEVQALGEQSMGTDEKYSIDILTRTSAGHPHIAPHT
ncbi:metal-sensing transcriptional repressor [Cryobacterium psychrophilum]|uniref:Metal-sensing transcriptional repressor n=1 Tax=Cryobacterium psychrophilum TaxID=41988 RepID=A0A4Y8KTQ8_9MICO|nr:metal-sensing transcriptional repressor [Cryobacterium psychrophilum]